MVRMRPLPLTTTSSCVAAACSSFGSYTITIH